MTMIAKFILILTLLNENTAFISDPSYILARSNTLPKMSKETSLKAHGIHWYDRDNLEFYRFYYLNLILANKPKRDVLSRVKSYKQLIEKTVRAKHYQELLEMTTADKYTSLQQMVFKVPNKLGKTVNEGISQLKNFSKRCFIKSCVADGDYKRMIEFAIYTNSQNTKNLAFETLGQLAQKNALDQEILDHALIISNYDDHTSQKFLNAIEHPVIKKIIIDNSLKGRHLNALRAHKIKIVNHDYEKEPLPDGNWKHTSVLLSFEGDEMIANCDKYGFVKQLSNITVPHKWGLINNCFGRLVFIENKEAFAKDMDKCMDLEDFDLNELEDAFQ